MWKDLTLSNTILRKQKRKKRTDTTKLQDLLQNYHNQHSVQLRKNKEIRQWNKIESLEIKEQRQFNGKVISAYGAGTTG